VQHIKKIKIKGEREREKEREKEGEEAALLGVIQMCKYNRPLEYPDTRLGIFAVVGTSSMIAHIVAHAGSPLSLQP